MRLCGSKPPGLPGHRVGLDDALPGADRADAADADLVLLDDQLVLAVLAFDDLRSPVAEFRVDVFFPEVERLQDVAVGIDDVIGAAPSSVSSSAWMPRWEMPVARRAARSPISKLPA